MKILFENLAEYDIQELIICSLEHALYQVIVVIDDEEYLVWEDDKKCFVSRNIMKIKEDFEPFNIKEMVLRQESAYDEMIGQPDRDSNRLEVPIGKTPYP